LIQNLLEWRLWQTARTPAEKSPRVAAGLGLCVRKTAKEKWLVMECLELAIPCRIHGDL